MNGVRFLKDLSFSTRHFLRRKQLKKVDRDLSRYYDRPFSLSSLSVENAVSRQWDILIIDKIPVFFRHEGDYFLTLRGLDRFEVERKYVTVDMGAVPYLANGADVMAPGIIDADPSIAEGDVIWVRDERNLRPLSLGLSKHAGEELVSLDKGKVIRTIHYVGDELWSFEL